MAHGASIIKDTDVLNKDTIMKVQMPNRDGFIDLYPGNSKNQPNTHDSGLSWRTGATGKPSPTGSRALSRYGPRITVEIIA